MSDVKLLRDASDAWMRVASVEDLASELIIISPYITGDSLSRVNSVKGDKKLLVFTCLDTIPVIKGSLDTNVLLEMIDGGATIWHHPRLHAKIIFSAQTSVVGSQNFTRKGSQNLEASVSFNMDNNSIAEMRAFIEDAKKEAVMLTREEIIDFQQKCDELASQHLEVFESIRELNKAPASAEARKNKFRSDVLSGRNKLKIFMNNNSRPLKRLKLVKRKWNYEGYVEGEYYAFQRVRKNTNLSTLSYKSSVQAFHRSRKLLCLDIESFTPFWVQLNVSEFSKFFQQKRYHFSTKKTEKGPIGGGYISINLRNPEETSDYSNIEIAARALPFYELVVSYFFDGFQFHERSRKEKIDIQSDQSDWEDHIENFEMAQALVVSEIQDHCLNDIPAWAIFTDRYLSHEHRQYTVNGFTKFINAETSTTKRKTLDRLFALKSNKLMGRSMFNEEHDFLVLGDPKKEDAEG